MCRDSSRGALQKKGFTGTRDEYDRKVRTQTSRYENRERRFEREWSEKVAREKYTGEETVERMCWRGVGKWKAKENMEEWRRVTAERVFAA